MPEQEALQLDERQHPDDFAGALGKQVVGAVAELVAVEIAPANAVEERRRRARRDEGVPALAVGIEEAAHDEGLGAHRCEVVHVHAAATSNTSSTRPQLKSRNSR